MCSDDVVLKVENLTKVFDLYHRRYQKTLDLLLPYRFRCGRFTAVDHVSFEVKRGERFGVMGANGSGKSTLLQLISGTMTPTDGRIFADGKMVSLLELGSSFSPQFTGRENIYMAGYLQGLDTPTIERHLSQILDFAELGDFIDQPLSTYSTGMMMRLAFATNIHIEADILILDEIFAVGDAAFVRKCMRFLKDFLKDKTVLFVSHDINLVATLCDRALLLNHGKVECLGDTLPVTEHYLEQCYEEHQNLNLKSGDTPPSGTMSADREKKPSITEEKNQLDFRSASSNAADSPVRLSRIVLRDALSGKELTLAHGGEAVKLQLEGEADFVPARWIIGFQFENARGEAVLGDAVTEQELPDGIHAGKFIMEFEFSLPRLGNDNYRISGGCFLPPPLGKQIQTSAPALLRINAKHAVELEMERRPIKLLKIFKRA